MINYKEALKNLLGAEKFSISKIAINKSCNYISAETIISAVFVPPFNNSAMDGFAVRSADIAEASKENPIILSATNTISAGDNPSNYSGDACEIMTGAVVPSTYDAVVKIEDVIQKSDIKTQSSKITITKPVPLKNNIRFAGEDLSPKDIIIKAGTTITPIHIMLLSTIGRKEILVSNNPKISIFATGKEVIDNAETPLKNGKIRNSNSPYLMAMFDEMNIKANYNGIIADEPKIFENKVKQVLNDNDIIISTGAVSMGKYDFIPDSLRKIGAEIIFHKVAIRPGKPILYAKFPDGTHYFGLPGNPISAAIGLRFFIYPLLRKLQGQKQENPINARFLMPFPKKQGLHFFRKAYVSVAMGGKLQLEILQEQESFKISPMLKANCWAVFTEEQTGREIGEAINIYPLIPNKWDLSVNGTYI